MIIIDKTAERILRKINNNSQIDKIWLDGVDSYDRKDADYEIKTSSILKKCKKVDTMVIKFTNNNQAEYLFYNNYTTPINIYHMGRNYFISRNTDSALLLSLQNIINVKALDCSNKYIINKITRIITSYYELKAEIND